jgi:heme-degrading monooxygenase HmoA
MIAQNVSMHLKPNRVAEFTRTMDREVIPLLRKQKGFQDELTFVASGGLEVIGISLWDQREDANAYSRRTYRAVLKALADVVEGTPRVETYDVANSTFHVIPARAVA